MRLRGVRGDPARRAGTLSRGVALSEEAWLHELFEPVGPITIRKMFGGAGVYRDGVMFALVSGEEVFLKCDEANKSRFDQAGCRPFTFERSGKTTETSYWSVPEEALDDAEMLKLWADRAYEAAIAAKQTKGRTRS